MSTGKYKKGKHAGKTVYKHRVAMERYIGRPLVRGEIVHHKNEDRSDNRVDNLELTNGRDHSRHHMLVHPVTKTCVICGAVFTPPPSHRPRDLTCSTRCRAAAISVARIGRVIDFWAVGRRGRSEGLRVTGRAFGISHQAVKRIARWDDDFAAKVTKYARRRFT